MGNEPKIFFHNEDYKEKTIFAQELTEHQKDELINKYPQAKMAFCALILLIESGEDIIDWECDFADIIFPEIENLKP